MHQNKRLFGYVFALLVLIVPHSYSPAAAEEPAGINGRSAREILHRLSDGVTRITLPNGLRILHYRRGQAPVFSAQIWVKVGGVDEMPGKTGIAHLLEHMAFKGTTTVGTSDWPREKELLARSEELELQAEQGDEKAVEQLKQVQAELEKIWLNDEYGLKYQKRGAVGLNAGTSKDYTMYLVSLPASEFEFWCWMESERLLQPVFRQFYKERSVVQEERRTRTDDSPDGRMYEALLATAYWAHPNRLPVIGWPSDLAGLHTGDIEDLYRTYYRPDNMVVAIVGDLDLAQIQPVIERYFGRLPKREEPQPEVITKEPPQNGERRSKVFFDAQPRMMLAYHKPVYPNRDDLYFSVLHSLLAEGRSSILYRELVQEKKIASSIDTTEAPGTRYPSLFVVSGTPRHGVANERLIGETQAILDRLKTQAPSSKDVEAAKKRVRVSMLSSLSSNYQLASLLAETELLWGSWEIVFEMYDITLATSAADLKRLAESYLRQENRTVITLEKPEKNEGRRK